MKHKSAILGIRSSQGYAMRKTPEAWSKSTKRYRMDSEKLGKGGGFGVVFASSGLIEA
jgi:hypothetical protein